MNKLEDLKARALDNVDIDAIKDQVISNMTDIVDIKEITNELIEEITEELENDIIKTITNGIEETTIREISKKLGLIK
jgi:hypothetical protein